MRQKFNVAEIREFINYYNEHGDLYACFVEDYEHFVIVLKFFVSP